MSATGAPIPGAAEIPPPVLGAWGLEQRPRHVVQAEGLKAIWRVDGDAGRLCLKRMPHEPDRCLFALAAQRHIGAKDGPVVRVHSTRDGSPQVVSDGVTYALFDWVEGRRPRLRRAEDRAPAAQALAQFHLASRGYEPPTGGRPSSKLGRWPELYQTMVDQMREAVEICRQNPAQRNHAAVIARAPEMLEQTAWATERLAASGYARWCEENDGSLCHQDFGETNLLLDCAPDGGARVLDLDGVTYDIPARDLRKLMLTLRKKAGPDAALDALQAYEQRHPLRADQLEVLWIDVAFPHEFHNVVKKARREPVDGDDAAESADADRRRAEWARAQIAALR